MASQWLRFIALLSSSVSLHDKMQGGSRADGGVRWVRGTLKVMPVKCNGTPPSETLGVISLRSQDKTENVE